MIIITNKKVNLKIMELNNQSDIIAQEMENYYKVYNHRKPCEEWKKNKWCVHYIKARAKKFRNKVNGYLNGMLALKRKAYI